MLPLCVQLIVRIMNIGNGTGPQRCVRCLRDKEEAIREHLRTNMPCCTGCPIGNEIRQALAKGHYTPIHHVNHDSDDFWSQVISTIVWGVVALPVYYISYEYLEMERLWAIITAVFWPVSLVIGFYYWLIKLIIGIF